MEAGEFRPVISVNDYGLVLGIGADGGWVVGGDSLPIGPAGERVRLRSLLPLLERPFREVDAAVAERARGEPGPPWPELLVLALRWPTEYWADRALDWIEDGWTGADLLDQAGPLPGRSQRCQHRVLRLRRDRVRRRGQIG